jgi:hypothetical protein
MEIKQKESEYTNDELEEMAIQTVNNLMSKKGIDLSEIDIDAKIIPIPTNPREAEQIKRGTQAGFTEDEYKEKKEELPSDEQQEIDKRNIINALTQGFALASQEEILLSDDENLPSEIFEDYFKFMKVALDTHWQIPTEISDDASKLHNMAVPAGSNHIKHEKGRYKVYAEGVILLILVQEIIKGIYEIFSFHGLGDKSKEELKDMFKFTDTYKQEVEGMKYGPAMVRHIKEFYNDLENKLIKDGKINEKNDILETILAMFYTYPADKFIEITAKLFGSDKSNQPFDEFEKLYLTAIDSDFAQKQNDEPVEQEVPKEQPKKELNLDDIIDKAKDVGYDNLSPEEKAYIDNM